MSLLSCDRLLGWWSLVVPCRRFTVSRKTVEFAPASQFLALRMEKICCLAVILLVGLSAANANVCSKPEVSAQSYTTPDATILTNIGFVAEFTLKCGNGVQNPALFAELGGKTQPVARIGANKYQVRPLS